MNSRVKKFLSYYKPYQKLFWADMACAFTVSGISLIIPMITRYITNTVLADETSFQVDIIMKLGALMVVMVLIEFACNYFITYKGHVMGVYMEHDMRNELFAHYQKLSFSFYDDQKTGKLMSRLTNDLFSLTELYHHGPEDIVISLIKIIGAFIILLNVNIPLTLIIFTIIPLMALCTFYYNKKLKKSYHLNKQRVAEINARIEDNLSGIRVVKSFANEDNELKKFNKENDRYVDSKSLSYQNMAGLHSSVFLFSTLITIVVIVFGSLFISAGYILVGDLVAYLLYVNNLVEPVKKLINFTETFQEGLTGFERFMDILEIEPDIQDKPDALVLNNVKGRVEFDQVSFRYKENLDWVLQNISLDVKPGEYLALVGSSGAGKTTLCSLIPRFYEVTSGQIRIDGTPITDVTLQSLRQNIGIVQQDVYLFAGTVMDNIRYGKPDATEEEIILAAKRANAHAFIMELPEGYDTDIGQRGVKLSGGQKQRLSIARVFLKNPPILIFDEATSALDNESEKIVQDSLEALAKNRTTFVIAHRLSTIRKAERIVVLSEEGIVETGTHAQLLQKEGTYASLYNMQFKM
ncbi:MAG: ABC transporter ATP-binding protein [Erysipelotrichaceae bacterium]|nr:ABC transporter ATP-binding protein [Erysipelotrichaceae bacterium]